jgi:hypothetical protein
MGTKKEVAREAAMPFFEAIDTAPFTTAQTRLLNTADRDLAVVLSPLSADERERVFALVGAAKAKRLQDELVRMTHVRLDPATISAVARHLAAHIIGEKPLGPASRYFRPHRE